MLTRGRPSTEIEPLMATPSRPAPGPRPPVTPPPDGDVFPKASLPPQVLKAFAQEMHAVIRDAMASAVPQAPPIPLATGHDAPASSMPPVTAEPGLTDSQNHAATDARYLAITTRVASYYQQRCLAVANYQQQQYQACTNAYRAKCRETMQSAMLVVAWYVRDRISRRRRRARNRFRRGLAEKCASRPAVTKGESVRRWIVEVEQGTPTTPVENDHDPRASPPHSEEGFSPREVPFDRDEVDFSMHHGMADKDTELLNVANNLMQNQLVEVHLPLFGVLSLDESDSESDEEDPRLTAGRHGLLDDGLDTEEMGVSFEEIGSGGKTGVEDLYSNFIGTHQTTYPSFPNH